MTQHPGHSPKPAPLPVRVAAVACSLGVTSVVALVVACVTAHPADAAPAPSRPLTITVTAPADLAPTPAPRTHRAPTRHAHLGVAQPVGGIDNTTAPTGGISHPHNDAPVGGIVVAPVHGCEGDCTLDINPHDVPVEYPTGRPPVAGDAASTSDIGYHVEVGKQGGTDGATLDPRDVPVTVLHPAA